MVREDPTQSMGSNCSLFDENAVLQTWYRNIWYLQTVSSKKNSVALFSVKGAKPVHVQYGPFMLINLSSALQMSKKSFVSP